ALRDRRRRAGDRARSRRPVAAAGPPAGRLRARERLPDAHAARAQPQPGAVAARGSARRARVPERLLHAPREPDPEARGPARPHAGAAGDALHVRLRAAARGADPRRDPAGRRRRGRRRPALRALRARARRGQPGDLGAARQGRRRRLQRGRLAGAAREDPHAAAGVRAQPADRARPDRVPQQPRAGHAREARGGDAGARPRRVGPRGAHQGRRHHALRAAHDGPAPGGARLGLGADGVARPLMRTSGIGTRYAFYVAALSLALVAVTLAASGAIALGRMRVLQQELRDAVTTARAADDERALDGAARYLGLHLFNPLYQLDVERLNEAIQQTQAWLPVVSFLVVDRDGLVLTDGTATNVMYGERAPGPLPRDDVPDPMLIRRDNVTELRFRVAAGGVSAGWGIVTLKEPPWEASLRRLEEERTAELWQGHRASLVSLGALVLLATVGVGVLVSLLLSRTLARPLTQMSRAAAQIAAGNLDHPLTLDSPDELGDLARALNRMARDLRAHEEALRAERSDLAAKNAELERFNYTVSHDLKTPLVTIRGFAGLAGGDLAAGRNDAVRKDLGRIVAAADKMHRLLDDLLELSRIGRVVHPPEDVALGGLVREG